MATSGGATSVIVAEDAPLILALLRAVFADRGFLVRTARDGAEALALAEADAPALVVADVEMPHVDGAALCRRLRESAATRSVPIVLISGVVEESAPGLERADAFLAKPFTLDELDATVERVLKNP